MRRLGYDAATGKTAYAVTEPGGALDKACDVFALQSATVWHSLAAAMVDGPALSADEANFVLAQVVECLGEVLPIAVRVVEDNPAADLMLFGESGREIGTAMRDMRE